MDNTGNKLEIRDLTFAYSTQAVLENINLTIKEREIVTIIGPNGGGKTTLLRLILGLERLQTGAILIDGKAVHASQQKIGYVPQHAHYDSRFPITVFEVVLSGAIRPFGPYTRIDKLNTRKALGQVGLSSLKDVPFSNLSGGQKQRMLIARSLVSDIDILLLDEPTSNIDPSGGRNLSSLLKELNRLITIVLVTHDMGFVSNITDRVLCVNRILVEHPIDAEFSKIVASSYGHQSKIVRHETALSGKTCDGGEHCE